MTNIKKTTTMKKYNTVLVCTYSKECCIYPKYWDTLTPHIIVLWPSQPNGVMSSMVSLRNHTFTGQAKSSKRLTSIVPILSPETDNCPSWNSRRERMTVENISWSNLHENMLQTQRGSNPQPPDHQSDEHPTEPLRPATPHLTYPWI